MEERGNEVGRASSASGKRNQSQGRRGGRRRRDSKKGEGQLRKHLRGAREEKRIKRGVGW